MKRKKIFITLSMLSSLCALSTTFTLNKNQVNNDTLIVNNEKVNLRQKAIKKENNITGANIETTNVDYDLRYLFGGEKNYLNYNIWDLLPTTNDSQNTSFRFLCAKPVGTNLYLYVYHNNNKNSEIVSANFKISKSKTQNKETGEFEENFSRYNARFINSYGYKQRFMKFAIDNIISTTEDVRCYIDDCFITYNGYSTCMFDIHDEFAFNSSETSDFMYEYFKDDYVKITDGEVSMLLTRIDNKSILRDGSDGYNYVGTTKNNYSDWAEDFYYFFTTNHEIDDLIEIKYDYELISYRHKEDYGAVGVNFGYSWYTYLGLQENANIIEESIEFNVNNKITKGTTSNEYTRPYFLWWNKEYTYQLENIQNCLDTSNLNTDENKGFKEFIEEVQNNRIENNKNKYQWAFRIGTFERSSEAYLYKYDVFSWNSLLNKRNLVSYSYCHEVKQTIITWLKFRTNDIDFEFNVLDIPKDTSSVHIQNVPYEVLGDILIENGISFYDWLIENGNWKLLLTSFGILGLVILFVYLYPYISTFLKAIIVSGKRFLNNTKMIKNDIKKKTNKKKQKKNKNKKEYTLCQK